jgi:hypothetical protein
MIPMLYVIFLVVDVILVSMIFVSQAFRFVAFQSGKMLTRSLSILKGLMIAPLLVIPGITVLIVQVWHSEPIARFTHALLVLGLWMLTTLLMLLVMLASRIKSKEFKMPLVGFLLVMLPTIYFTPINHFFNVFDQNSEWISLLIAVGLIGFNYAQVIRLNRQLRITKVTPIAESNINHTSFRL